MGGPGTIEYYPVSPGLVINQTGDIHEQIADLLDALRRRQDANAGARVAMEKKTCEFPDVVFLTSGMRVRAVIAVGNLDKDALERGTRIEMMYPAARLPARRGPGALDKAAELACETLALDESAHLLSFFGRVYLTHMKSEFASGHTGCKVQGAEEACEPADTNECPAVHGPICPAGGCKTHEGNEECPPMKPTTEPENSVSTWGLEWPVITSDDKFMCFGSPIILLAPPPCPVLIPWCPESPSVDIHSPINFYPIRADAPLSTVNIPLLILDEEQSEKAQVFDPDSTSNHDCTWSKIMAGPMRAEVVSFGLGHTRVRKVLWRLPQHGQRS